MEDSELYSLNNEPSKIQYDKFGRWVSRKWDNGYSERYIYRYSVKKLEKKASKRSLRDAYTIEKVVKKYSES